MVGTPLGSQYAPTGTVADQSLAQVNALSDERQDPSSQVPVCPARPGCSWLIGRAAPPRGSLWTTGSGRPITTANSAMTSNSLIVNLKGNAVESVVNHSERRIC